MLLRLLLPQVILALNLTKLFLALRHKDPTQREELIVLRALKDSTIPKLIGEDILLFSSILQDLFPGMDVLSEEEEDLKQCIYASLKKFGLQAIPDLILKCLQLYRTLESRVGVMLVGDSFTGKTTCYKVLADAINGLKAHRAAYANINVDIHIINPKSVTIEELYGFTDASLNWTDGILSQMIRTLVLSPSTTINWIILGKIFHNYINLIF